MAAIGVEVASIALFVGWAIGGLLFVTVLWMLVAALVARLSGR